MCWAYPCEVGRCCAGFPPGRRSQPSWDSAGGLGYLGDVQQITCSQVGAQQRLSFQEVVALYYPEKTRFGAQANCLSGGKCLIPPPSPIDTFIGSWGPLHTCSAS